MNTKNQVKTNHTICGLDVKTERARFPWKSQFSQQLARFDAIHISEPLNDECHLWPRCFPKSVLNPDKHQTPRVIRETLWACLQSYKRSCIVFVGQVFQEVITFRTASNST